MLLINLAFDVLHTPDLKHQCVFVLFNFFETLFYKCNQYCFVIQFVYSRTVISFWRT